MTARQLRLLRAAGASGIATLLAAVSHAVGGGALPDPLFVVGLAILLIPVVSLMIGRGPGRFRIALAVLLSQGAFHLLFHGLSATVGGAGAAAHHGHAELTIAGATPLATDTGMLAAHLVAAALTTLLLWRGERAVVAIARWVRVALQPMPASPTPVHRPPAPWSDRILTPRAIALQPIARRGPPALVTD